MSELKFKKLTNKRDDLEAVYNFEVKAFTNPPGVDWSIQGLKKAIEEGWEIYSCTSEDQIVAALFTKKDKDQLLTKNTSLKMEYQGNAFSHRIKEFYEELATSRSLGTIVSICRDDDFRTISLNESHGYSKLGDCEEDGESFLEWQKTLAKVSK